MRRNASDRRCHVLEDFHPENVREQRPEHAPDARDALGARGFAQRLLPPRDALGHRPFDLGNAARDVAVDKGREDLGEDGCYRADGREAHASPRPERRPVVGPLEERRHGAGGLLVHVRQHPRHDVAEASVAQDRVQVDEEPAPRLLQDLALARGRPIADGEERPERRGPERLHRLGHHLHVAERDVEVESTVARLGRRVERGDGTALDDEERAARAAPLDVLRPAEVSLDPRPQCRKLEDELVRERLPLLVACGDLLGHRPAIGQAPDGERLPGDAPGDDRPGADLVQVGGDEARDERLADPEARVDGDGLAAPGDRVRGEHDPGDLGEDHPLDDHREEHRAVREAVRRPIGDGPVGEERGPAPPHRVEQVPFAPDVQVGVLLPRKRRGGEVLGGGARADRVGVLGACLPPGGEDRGPDGVGDRKRGEMIADPFSELSHPREVARVRALERVEQPVELRARGDELPVRRRRDAEPGGDREPRPRHLAEVGALAADERHGVRTDLRERENVGVHGSGGGRSVVVRVGEALGALNARVAQGYPRRPRTGNARTWFHGHLEKPSLQARQAPLSRSTRTRG